MISKSSLCTIFIVALVSLDVSAEKFPTVTIENGDLKGIYLTSRGGREYSAFLGIPYAKPPERFKLAKPSEPWKGIRNAEEFGNRCYQKVPMTSELIIFGSEDCLFINVYSPKLDENLPVMVFIHGGAFVCGASNDHKAKFFMDENVVLVTFNYRLGPLLICFSLNVFQNFCRFLNTGDGEVEANLGLKDQLLALQFIQKNIKAFGGDLSQITIFGESAGAALVHHHVLSPLSKGLFRKAIMQSGTALGFGLMANPAKPAFKLGRLLGCFLDTSEETSEILLECLKNATPEDILNHSLEEWFIDPIATFAPTLEKSGKSEQIFIADTPTNIMKSGNFNKVPMIFMVCEEEGLLMESIVVLGSEKLTTEINEDSLRIFPITLNYDELGYFPYEKNWISLQVKNFYFGSNKIDMSTIKNLTNMYSDRLFLHGAETSAKLHAKHSKVFNGIFTHNGTWSYTSIFGIQEVIGVTHSDELQYLFDSDYFPEPSPESKEEYVSKEMIKLWTTFATKGDSLSFAGVSWVSVDASKLKKEGLSWFTLGIKPKLLQNPFKERMEFWDDILDNQISRPDGPHVPLTHFPRPKTGIFTENLNTSNTK